MSWELNISLKRIIREIAKNKLIIILFTGVFLILLTANSYRVYSDALKNKAYVSEMYFYISAEKENPTAYEEIKTVLLSDSFKDKVKNEQGIALNDDFYNQFVVMQYSKWDERNGIKIIFSEKKQEQAENFLEAISISGVSLIEYYFGCDVNIVSSSTKKVILTDLSDVNSAVDYDLYINKKIISFKNIVLWGIMGLFLSTAIATIYSIIYMKIRECGDLKNNLINGVVKSNGAVEKDDFLIELINLQQISNNVLPVIVYSMDSNPCKQKLLNVVTSYFENNIKSFELIDASTITYDKLNLSDEKIYAFDLNEQIKESNRDFVIFKTNSLDETFKLISLFEEKTMIMVEISSNKYRVTNICELCKLIESYLKTEHNYELILHCK